VAFPRACPGREKRPDPKVTGRWELVATEWIPIAAGVSAAFGFIFIPKACFRSRSRERGRVST